MKILDCNCVKNYSQKEGWQEYYNYAPEECEIGYGSWCEGYSAVMIAKMNYCPQCGKEYKEEI